MPFMHHYYGPTDLSNQIKVYILPTMVRKNTIQMLVATSNSTAALHQLQTTHTNPQSNHSVSGQNYYNNNKH